MNMKDQFALKVGTLLLFLRFRGRYSKSAADLEVKPVHEGFVCSFGIGRSFGLLSILLEAKA